MKKSKSIDETARVLWPVMMAFWFAFILGSILLGGCASVKAFGEGTKDCLSQAFKSVSGDVQNQVSNDVNKYVSTGVAPTSVEVKTEVASLGIKYGFRFLACGISKLFNRLLQKPADTMMANNETNQVYLKSMFSLTVKEGGL